MRFKRIRLLITAGAVVATMSFAGVAMASPFEHNSQPVTKSKAAYTHNHASHMSGWKYNAPMYNTNMQQHNNYNQNHNGSSHE